MYFYEIEKLEPLEDVTYTIQAEEDSTIFDEENTLVFIETALNIMDEYINDQPHAIAEPDFHDFFTDEIKELFWAQFEDLFFLEPSTEDDLDEMLDIAFELFFTTFYKGRSYYREEEEEEEDNEIRTLYHQTIEQKIQCLKGKPQPQQRTNAWYEFRHNLITASNAYKVFESQSQVNQLIYEKCQPLKKVEEEKQIMVNVNTTLHWGQKYEPLSVMLYENMFKTKVDDFGCIQHDGYPFLGASPDGINIEPKNERYGRMLEIKNIVNREINGIPKKEYWIQMQLQMEVCDLDECDFLETKFSEYENFQQYEEEMDSSKKKGVIMYFNTQESRPYYVYKPLEITELSDILAWEEEMIDKYQSESYKMIWIKNCYWKLDKLSCVLVLRNKKWFQDNIGKIEEVWNIIEKERISGYEHRAPNRKAKKEFIIKTENTIIGCFLNIHKLNETNSEIKIKDHNISDEKLESSNKMISIRTESFDDTKKTFTDHTVIKMNES